MRYSPKDLIEAIERLNIDHQDTTVYVEVELVVGGKTQRAKMRCEGFYVQGFDVVITSREGV